MKLKKTQDKAFKKKLNFLREYAEFIKLNVRFSLLSLFYELKYNLFNSIDIMEVTLKSSEHFFYFYFFCT